jgi:uncharacterized protein
MDEPAVQPGAAAERRANGPDNGVPAALDGPAQTPLARRSAGQPSDPRRSPDTDWRPWTALLALVGGIVLAAVAGLIVDVPAIALGVKITSSHTPPGIEIADTFVQDIAFVGAAVSCAHLGGRVVRSWQFGLRRPAVGWVSAGGLVLLLLVVFLVLSVVWSAVLAPEKEKLLEQLGSNEGTALLLFSAGLTCVIAPICEEFLFRGYIFTALRNWHGTWPAAIMTAIIFGGVHVGSAPALDLVPLGALGFGLCVLYRYTGSLYPCIAAHSLNNSLAFSSLERWGWQAPVLMVGALLGIAVLVRLAQLVGLISRETPAALPSA